MDAESIMQNLKIGPGRVSLEDLRGEIGRASERRRAACDDLLVLEVHPEASICVPEVRDEDVPEYATRSARAVKYFAEEMRREALRREVAALFAAFSDAGVLPTHLVLAASRVGATPGRAFVVPEIVRWARFEPSSEEEVEDEAAAFRKFAARIRSIDRLDELVDPRAALGALFENVPALEDLTVGAVIHRRQVVGADPLPKRLKTLTVLCREHEHFVSAKELVEELAPSAERIRLARDLYFDRRDVPASAIEAALADQGSTLEFVGPAILLNTGSRPQFSVPRLGPDVSELTVHVVTAEGLCDAVAGIPATVKLVRLLDATFQGISGSGIVRDCVSAFLKSPPERAGAVLDVSELLQEGDAPQDVLDFAASLGAPGVTVKVGGSAP